ncbi:sporulation protein YunB [Ammoniphilus resinae]|uniref:Sporulation protein YunB n=1 Tax=Ammoniphilus resinae TaxID=861532 RepID=A0ABS4GX66_9BACL|nr:sporulation protein YunB [Ammoniphilus resinae]MBP1934627.1 sporulation protein YunB [Ammoniphilus resinae]
MAFRSRKRVKPLSFKTAFITSLVIFSLISIQTFLYIEQKLEPAMMRISKTKVEQLAADAINGAISKHIAEGIDFKELVYFREDGNGEIKAILFNYNEQTRIVGVATNRVSNTLKELESVPLEIPLGQALDSNILAMIGPDVPITMVPMGSVQVSLIPEVKEAGINMVHINVYIDIQAKVQVVIPFTTEPTVIRSKIPITQGLFMGDVPNFYFKGSGSPEKDGAPVMPPIQFNTGPLNE